MLKLKRFVKSLSMCVLLVLASTDREVCFLTGLE